MERWKDIDTCKGYEVSNTGQIRSKKDLTPVPVKYFKGYKWVVLESNDGHKSVIPYIVLSQRHL